MSERTPVHVTGVRFCVMELLVARLFRFGSQRPPILARPPGPLRALKADIARTYGHLAGSRLRRILGCCRTPGVHAVTVYRFGQWLQGSPRLVRLVFEPAYLVLNLLVQILWGIELPRGAKIGPGLYIGHFGGITVSPDTVMGARCALSQNITIGFAGHGEKAGVPVFGDDVYIAPGARVFGKIRVGDNVKIGANAVVYRDVPNNAVVALDPGFKIVSFSGNRRAPVDLAA
jgi:serine O-acetyltransferase